ncbi:BirA family biotin operon repressor/biotin-[acetyl-CoA-carboxylase] ligase [Inhella inkyongensis]|uniref:BirA family biotin operon repressor/biotin-[acetyl-CoA-carboxylase] ligase n=1 Tax=Inhella inkyongensis TaxID=392593 RepID=A0A840RYD3_9BURK|nr:biotin--[acetyl-CoA-carboxylase] ligase [Inhella inkyongensis]MBB5202965.1 BirA family biotin operon repressor/biotin-[acetyl-CoA-carboxylase] ligase [Inhella inkyongensis]
MDSTLQLDWGTGPLAQALGPGLRVEVRACCGSTNTELLALCREGLSRPHLLVAEQQTAGRGRLGRQWQSWPGASLTFSLAWPWEGAPLDGLSLAVGAALAEALDPAGQLLQLKWPNDLWLARRKLGGILIETVSQGGGSPRAVVVGVGLNIEARPDAPAELRLAGLRECDARWSAPLALAAVAPALMDLLQHWPRQGWAHWQGRYAPRDGLIGLPLQIGGNNGLGAGTGPGGELLLAQGQGRPLAVSAGEASVQWETQE